MDKSKQYIRMCEKAEEIQAYKGHDQIACGSIFAFKGNICLKTFVADWIELEDISYYTEDLIWLPRQDQLQELVINGEVDFLELMEDFYWHWAGYKTDEQYPWWELVENRDKEKIRADFTSMEQLWLTFVMKEKHNKIWAEDSWKATTI